MRCLRRASGAKGHSGSMRADVIMRSHFCASAAWKRARTCGVVLRGSILHFHHRTMRLQSDPAPASRAPATFPRPDAREILATGSGSGGPVVSQGIWRVISSRLVPCSGRKGAGQSAIPCRAATPVVGQRLHVCPTWQGCCTWPSTSRQPRPKQTTAGNSPVRPPPLRGDRSQTAATETGPIQFLWVACPEGLEPPTCCLEGSCSIQLSYGQ